MRKRIYVAGACNADNNIDRERNRYRALCVAGELLALGFSPYLPHTSDQVLHTMTDCEAKEITEIDFIQAHLAQLYVQEAVVVTEHSEDSINTQHEIHEAERHGIPVFYSIDDLMKWTDGE